MKKYKECNLTGRPERPRFPGWLPWAAPGADPAGPAPFFSLLYGAALFLYAFSFALGRIRWAAGTTVFTLTAAWIRKYFVLLFIPLILRELWIVTQMFLRFLRTARTSRPAAGGARGAGPEGARTERDAGFRYLLYAVCGLLVFCLMFFGAWMTEIPLLVYFSKELRLRDRFKVSLAGIAPAAVVYVIALALGVLAFKSYPFRYFGVVRTYTAYGTGHPNTGARLLFFPFLCLWYVFGKQHKKFFYAAGAVLYPVFIFVCGCRTAVLLLTAWFLCCLLIRILSAPGGRRIRAFLERKDVRRALRVLYTLLPFFLLLATILIGFFYYRYVEETPSSYFARRFREFFLAYRQFGFGAFARKLNVQKEEFYYLDSSFVWMIFAKGLLFAAGLLFTLCAADRAVIGSGDAKLLVISFILQLYMVMERIPSYVIFILFLSAASLLVPYGKAPPRNGPAGSGGGDGK